MLRSSVELGGGMGELLGKLSVTRTHRDMRLTWDATLDPQEIYLGLGLPPNISPNSSSLHGN